MATVLVVDDNQTNRELVVSLLKHRGHQPLEADDGAEGLALVRARHPDLVISDILMPTMDGFEFVRQMRADPAIAETEVLFYTATYHEREARHLARGCGVARVLSKPSSPEDILVAIDESLRRDPSHNGTHVGDGFDRQHLQLITNKLHTASEDLQISNLRLSALIDLNMRLASEHDPETLLESVCRGARDLIGAKYAVLAVREKGDSSSIFSTTSGLEPAVTAALPPVRIDDGALGVVQRERRPRRFALLNGDPRAIGLPTGFPPMRSSLIAPITSVEKIYGWICLAEKLGDEAFSDDDEGLLVALAGQVGRIYENGSLYRQVRGHVQRLQAESEERRRVVEDLRDSETRFRQLAENIREVFFLIDPANTKMLYVSPAYEEVWGRSCASLYAEPNSWIDSIHVDDRERIRLMFEDSLQSGRFEYEYRIVREDGVRRWIWARGFPIRNEAGRIYRIAGVAEDITERKRSEEKIQRLNRVHAMLSGINSLIVRVRKRDELFREACRLAVDQGRFALAWIGLIEPSSHMVRPVAAAGNHQEFAHQLQIPLNGADGKASSLAALGVKIQEVVVCNDIVNHGGNLLFRGELIRRGFRSCAALPLVVGGTTVGIVVLYASEPDFFDDEEISLLGELASDISFGLDHIDKEEELNFLAYYDRLTRLPNRALFRDRISHCISSANREQRSVAIVIADAQRFKSINDAFGRQIGDQLLCELGARLAACAGAASDVARIGAGQFAAILADAKTQGDILTAVEQWWSECFRTPFAAGGAELMLTAKAGIALYPGDGQDADSLLQSAEAALSRAKASGETFVFYHRRMTERVTERLTFETKLRRALENDEFQLYYQPKVDVDSRRIQGVEALIRWHSPELGVVPPGRFISLMEETGLIVKAGAWALRRAVLDRRAWLELKLPAPRVAVNVSTVQLHKHDFVQAVQDALGGSGADPGIDLEVTESLIMEDMQGSIEKLTVLSGMGIRIAIDDFGTGFSSLGYLAKLPVHTLKIDLSFIHAMLDDPNSMSLVSTMISLAHSLKLSVVAEGVETEEQANVLRLLRCDQMQGFLVSRPMPMSEMTAWLAAAAH